MVHCYCTISKQTQANTEDYAAKGDEFEKKAEKKLAGWNLFGSKQNDAADLYDKAANQFKLAKRCKRITGADSTV